MGKEELLTQITEHLNDVIDVVYYSSFGNEMPERGEIVLAYRYAGMEYCFDHQIARVLQIRTGCGQFGSDMYFLRLPDGSLITSENQMYRKIPEQFIEEVEKHFETDIEFEKEGFEGGFTIKGEQLEVGFIVDGKKTTGTPDTPFTIAITSQG